MGKTYFILAVAVLGLAFTINSSRAQSSATVAAPPPSSAYAVVERGANHRVWQRETYEMSPSGQVVTHLHKYTELATGMHYQDANGQWAESKELIEPYPGGAVARQGQYQVIFANNLNSHGAIDMQTPDGKRLRSNVLGLMYVDTATGDAVLIARLQDSEGQLISDNQVLYPNAFEGVKADVQYTYRRAGFEQDVILREQPPAPESFGMNPATSELEVFTEFINPPEASVKDNAADNGLEADQEIGWGDVMLGRGKAFDLGDQTTQVPVAKRYVKLQGRYFLAEKVSLKDILPAISKLPEQAANQMKLPVMAFKNLTLPKTPLARSDASPMRLASSALPDKGYVLDYMTFNNTTNQSYTTFQGDTTYYISGTVYIGSSTFEGGAVLKYASGASLVFYYYSPVWQASAYRPVIFTAKDDNTVGETIYGSTGNPTGYYASCPLFFGSYTSPTTISNFRISYAQKAITLSCSGNPVFSNGQLVNCNEGINFGYSGINLSIRNMLFANVGTGFRIWSGLAYSGADVQNTTFSSISGLVTSSAYYYGNLSLKNCILANVSSLTNVSGSFYLSGTTNGFYKCRQFGTGTITNTFNPFQTVGAGSYYLTNGCNFLNAGTTNIDATLLASLKQKTTQPPLLFSNVICSTNLTLSPQAQRDTDTPDLGYHYDPLDYLTCNFTCTNGAQLTIAGGTAIGGGNATGIALGSGCSLTSTGTPQNPNWFVRYQSVQEQSRQLGGANVSAGQPVSATGNPTAIFQFSKFACPAGGGGHIYNAGNAAYGSLLVRNCEFFGGNNTVGGRTNTATTLVNNLFWRSPLVASNTSPASTLALSNNLVYGAAVSFSKPASVVWYAFNNAFDTCTLTGSTLTNGYNAYLGCTGRLSPANAQDVVRTTTLGYASSWLGNYYQPTTSPLINAGSTTADRVGLYEFTTQTSQAVEAGSMVDIGYHYVAVDAYGNPLETLTNGIPDYLVDANGDGLPDWWELLHFGQLGVDPNADPDGDGFSNLQEYQMGTDPNVANANLISYSLTLAGHVNTNVVNAAVSVIEGKPFFAAVLVDDTNLADTTWTAYTSSNLTVNLGGTEGWHEVRIGLRGYPTNSYQSWRYERVKLDVTPPLLVLTNVPAATVTVPLVQVQGFSPEALQGVSCTVSNSADLNTNIYAALTGQTFDTSQWEVTTNFFQAYDIPLAVGPNMITLQATDLAGNVTVTNFSVTLDYTNATNPAVPMLIWPPDGTPVGGSNFTLQAQIADPTATVTVTIVNTNGSTSTVHGLVNRNGQVLVNNIPLGGGASAVTLTVTSAAGKSTSTSVNVTGNDLGLTMTPLTSNQWQQASVTVSGFISDGSYTVKVNGVTATIVGDPVWTATVPLPAGSPANFTVDVYDGNSVLVAEQEFSQWRPLTVHAEQVTIEEHSWDYVTGNCGDVMLTGFDYTNYWNSTTGSTSYWAQVSWGGYCGGGPYLYTDTVAYASNYPDFYNPHQVPVYNSTNYVALYAWENVAIDGWAWPAGEDNRQRTKVVIDPGSQGTTGAMKTYLVRASAIELEWGFGPDLKEPLPPEWLAINGQALVNSGVTNAFSVFADEDTAVFGTTVVSAPAGTKVDVTPVAVRLHGDNFYEDGVYTNYADARGLQFTATQTYPITDYTFDVVACEFPAPVADNSRDGKIVFDGSDDTTPGKPFRFWINDSKESGDIAAGAGDQIPGLVFNGSFNNAPNYAYSHVQGRSDLVNFFPVALNLADILQQFPLTNGYTYHLSQADSAVKFVYASLTPGNAFDYLTNTASTGYGTNADEDVTGADTVLVLPSGAMGTTLATNWLMRVQTNGGAGILLVEGRAATTKPLMLEIWHKDQYGVLQKLGGVPMYLSIGGMEQMFRHLNLRVGADAPASLPGPAYSGDTGVTSSMGEPANFPDNLLDNKWMIFAHGYNVSAQESRGWEAEMFKRFYWSNSKAKFVGVDWRGNPEGANFGASSVFGIPDYYLAEMNAFATAPQLASKINALAGSKTIVGHSLGCELTAFALNDFGLQVNHACLMDAAVAQECFDGDADDNLTAMQPSAWQGYDSRLFAAHWHERFDSSDARSTLTWRNRFASALTKTSVYSFYSSTEDVLGEYDGDPTSAIVENGFAALTSWSTSPLGNYAWVVQEKTKGSIASLFGITVQGSDYGGWGFNPCDGYLTNYPVWYKLTGGGLREMKTPSDIGTVTQDLLNGSQFNPLFKDGWGTFNGNNPSAIYVNADASLFTGPSWILGLYQPNQGSTVAADPAKNAQLLAQAIPALSLPVGAKFTTAFDNQNYNMPVSFTDGTHWPNDRGIKSGSGIPNWHHSDISQVAYPYLYKLFNQLVSISNQ